MAEGVQQSATNGVRQQAPLPEEDDVEFVPGGSSKPNPDTEEPGGTAATHQPPAE